MLTSVADLGCFIQDPDPNIFHSGSRIWIRTFFIPDPRAFITRGKKVRTNFFHASYGFSKNSLKSRR
jgi:hypothetical protein